MNLFEKALNIKLKNSLKNNFGRDNFDEYRFGNYTEPTDIPSKQKTSVLGIIKDIVKMGRNTNKSQSHRIIKDYGTKLNDLYNKLNKTGQELLVELIAYRILGYRKVKLSVNNTKYWDAVNKVDDLKINDETINPNFMHFVLEKFDLRKIGYKVTLFFMKISVAVDFIIEQYAYKENDKVIVGVEKGDVVLDIGGCWGDTALYFADKAGEKGKVYSFEFIPNNINIHNINTNLNVELKKNIEIVDHPVSSTSDEKIFYLDNGPGSTISSKDFESSTGSATTISIDDFVKRNNIEKIDFIKMDIEGAEPAALKGAMETIKKYKPKLAIAIYHSMDDFVNIPEWITNLDCGYEIFLGHYTIHAEETVIFAKVK